MRKQSLHILPSLVPRNQAVRGGRVAQVVEPWLCPGATISPDPRLDTKAAENTFDTEDMQSAPRTVAEEARCCPLGHRQLSALARISRQGCSQLRADRHQPALEKLGLLDDDMSSAASTSANVRLIASPVRRAAPYMSRSSVR